MSEKKNFPNKENSESKLGIDNELDGDRLKNNIKKFSFILEDKKTIKKKPTVTSPSVTQEKKDERGSRKNTVTNNTKSFNNNLKSDETGSEKNKSLKDPKKLKKEKTKSKEETDKENSSLLGIDTDVNFYLTLSVTCG